MKSYKQFISEAREAKAFLAGDLPITKSKKKKVGQKVVSKKKSNDISTRANASDVSVPSASSQEVDTATSSMSVGTTWDVLTTPSQSTSWSMR